MVATATTAPASTPTGSPAGVESAVASICADPNTPCVDRDDDITSLDPEKSYTWETTSSCLGDGVSNDIFDPSFNSEECGETFCS